MLLRPDDNVAEVPSLCFGRLRGREESSWAESVTVAICSEMPSANVLAYWKLVVLIVNTKTYFVCRPHGSFPAILFRDALTSL